MTERTRNFCDRSANDNLERATLDTLRGADDPRATLQAMVRAGHELNPKTEPMRRIVQKLTAGAVECQILARARILHALWPDAQVALAHRTIARQVVGIPDADLERAGETLGEGVTRAVHEAAEAIPGFNPGTWDLVLIELLVPPRGVSTLYGGNQWDADTNGRQLE
jgi:hypothetical protein